ncbi:MULTISPECIES: F0F1 ATP synthase subunit B family protein [Desulfobacula]|uniref:ATP synthase subunit b n=2 Tax=Desulfobacula TaxID=28222 RepID=K0NJS0_DESTT|nr:MULTISPECIES: ATP synthase F0 subunit B [Desulfobacula]CCK80128.1 AtpF2: ATP synthase, subunit B (ATP synthase F(0) sector subunit b) (F-type ATPase subunit b) [Desulfobacula toluolica Tol2]SDU14794.1 F-type H+-transporting ATPase subunit b [Desulfobacula phenolica]
MKKCRMNKGLLLVSGFVVSLVLCGVAFASSDGGHGGVHNAWLQIDTWKVLNFGILAVVGFLLAKKPVAEFFASRAKSIADEIEALEQKKADAEKKLAEYQAKFKNLDQESKQIVEDYTKQGEEAKARIIAQAEAQAEKLEDMAKRNIDQEFKSAKIKLQQEIVEKALDKAEEIIKASIKPKDQNKLVDDYLKKVVA